jgi:hypothetical protein
MTDRSWRDRLPAFHRDRRPVPPAGGGVPANRGRGRLIALLCLFDALLIAAVLLSFQATDLVEEERTLVETRTVYEVLYRDQTVTQTETITHLLPYGSVP